MARYGCTITVAAGKIPSSQSNFSWVATQDNFPTAAIDGGAQSILNGGGNLRCYTDSTKATQIPIEVVEFVTGGTPSVVVWGLSPTLNAASTVYIEADTVATSQPAASGLYGSEAVWVDNFAMWHMEENPSGTAPQVLDSSANSIHMTSAGEMTSGDLIQAKVGDGLNFDGIDDELESISPLSGASYSVSCWFKTNSTTKTQSLTQARLSSDILPIAGALQLLDNGVIRFLLRDDAGLLEILDSSTGAYAADTYYHVNANRDGSNMELFLNGSLLTSKTATLGATTTNNFFVAVSNSAAFFDGAIDELTVTNTAITPTRIAAEYNNQSSPSTFWTTSAWADQDGGASIDITESSATISLLAQDPVISFTGLISVQESLATIDLTSNNPIVDLTGSISISESSETINLTSIDPLIILTQEGLLTVEESVAFINITNQDPVILFSGVINIEENTNTIDLISFNPVIDTGVLWTDITPTTTTWTDSTLSSTIWTDK